jgi:hypothetical protein
MSDIITDDNESLLVHNKTKIVCGFPGTGKSYFAEHQKDYGITIIDIDSSLFSWVYQDGHRTKERNIDFPRNYINEIDRIIRENNTDILLVSTQKIIRNYLEIHRYNPIIVYPDISLKNAYYKRYVERDNRKQFIKDMMNTWEDHIITIENEDKDCCKCRLRTKNDYISNISFFDNNKMHYHLEECKDINVPTKVISHCCLCKKEITNHESYYTNNFRDVCVDCNLDISKYFFKECLL